MDNPTRDNVTRLLNQWSGGDSRAADELLPLIYTELHRLASWQVGNNAPAKTLQPTALVNEVYLKLVDRDNLEWENRSHFFAVASKAMRGVLIDHLRSMAAAKRGGGFEKLSLKENLVISEEDAPAVLALDEALDRLTEMDEQLGRIVEMRFFGGLTHENIAEVLGVSSRTVIRGWKTASTWLRAELSEDS